MKTKNGQELTIIGQINIDHKLHFIVKMPQAFYQDGRLISMIVLPASEFEYNNGIENAEVIKGE